MMDAILKGLIFGIVGAVGIKIATDVYHVEMLTLLGISLVLGCFGKVILEYVMDYEKLKFFKTQNDIQDQKNKNTDN